MVEQLLFAEYFYQWMKTFKKPAIAPVTYIKYKNTYEHIKNYFGTIELAAVSRQDYQAALNKFAKTHAKRTTAGFHKQMRAAVLDALEENFISTDFTRKAIIGGRDKEKSKAMFLSYSEWKRLVNYTRATSNSYDFIIYLSAMTGLRFAEVLGLTVADIDLKNKSLTVNKTWDYKYHTGFKAPKNSNSVRTIDIDTQTLRVIKKVIRERKFKLLDQKICINTDGKLPVSATINRYLENLCDKLEIPQISFHGLRHPYVKHKLKNLSDYWPDRLSSKDNPARPVILLSFRVLFMLLQFLNP